MLTRPRLPHVPAGNNLEAGLGALVTKRLVGAHLAAKQAAAAAMQEQLEREQEVRWPVSLRIDNALVEAGCWTAWLAGRFCFLTLPSNTD